MINFEAFQQIDLRVGRIERADRVEDSDQLVRLEVNLGKEKRQLVAGLAQSYSEDDLEGREIVVVANLEPKEIFGLESQGMLLAATDGEPVLLEPEQEVEPGAEVS